MDSATLRRPIKVREALGLTVGIDLDKPPAKRFRVNNGTPCSITVYRHFQPI
jgi:hypothetical protein